MVLDHILAQKLVAILRADSTNHLVEASRALLAGGIDCIEVTFTVPRAHDALETLADALGDQATLGAGTILDTETARIAILAGARYLVTPTFHTGVIELGRRYGVPVLAGAFTPTEILAAWQAGSEIVKVFPSDVTGPKYLRAIRGPLPQIRLMPTGGVTLDTAADFLDAGAAALGIGGALASSRAIADADFAGIRKTAQQFRQLVDAWVAEHAP